MVEHIPVTNSGIGIVLTTMIAWIPRSTIVPMVSYPQYHDMLSLTLSPTSTTWVW